MKAQLGDYIWLYGRRRVIVRIQRCKHGGHCYYGIRFSAYGSIYRFASAHNVSNYSYDGNRLASRIYWIRSDRLTLFDGQALRDGRSGRPKLEYRLGRKRAADQEKS